MTILRTSLFGAMLGLAIGALLGCGVKNTQAPTSSVSASHSDTHSHSLPGAGDEHADHSRHPSDGEAADLIVSTQPAEPHAGDATQLRLMVHEASGKMIREFEETHTKLAHLIVVREGLDEFAHLHPEVDARGNMKVDYVFPHGGEYHLFLDYKPKGGEAATAKAKSLVSGDAPQPTPLKATVPGKVSAEGLQASVSVKKDGEATIVAFYLIDSKGEAITDLQPYLGAMGHLVAICDDGEQYAHSHPLTETPGASRVEFEVHFPGPGLYKLWGQFQRQDQVITVPAVLNVEESGHAH